MSDPEFDPTAAANLWFAHSPSFTKKPEDSGYYYWYAFLRLVDDYDEHHPLWADFGDVKHLDFEAWWDEGLRGEDLFATGLPQGADEVDTEAEFLAAKGAGHVVIYIDPACTRSWIDDCVKKILNKHVGEGKRGPKGNKDADDDARYLFERDPNCRFLEKCLLVYKCSLDKSLKPIDIADEIRRQHGVEICKSALDEGDIDSIRSTVGRYRSQAQEIIEGVGKGRFPLYTGKGS